jgi:predicted nucleotide-binding protein (sugar kinase/HSP70/actin superfamily)
MGMYEADMRKALKGAGFPNFRIAMIDIASGLDLNQESAGVHLKPKTFWRGGKIAICADLMSDLACQIRPYEVNPGETNVVLDEALRRLSIAGREALSARRTALAIKRLFSGIEVDYLRVKPRVKVTGEFFLKHAEGQSNHRLLFWLEEEGAEVMRESIGAWIEYMIWLNELKVIDRLFVKADKRGWAPPTPGWFLGLRAQSSGGVGVSLLPRAAQL